MATKQTGRTDQSAVNQNQQGTQPGTQPGTQQDDSNTVKNPDEWKTGDEPMTGAQRSYLKTLCEEAQEPMDESLTKAQASERIEALQQRTGRGAGASAKGAEPHGGDAEGRVDA